MTNKKMLVLLTVSLLLSVVMAACNTGGNASNTSSGGNPADAAKSFFDIVFTGKGDPNTLVCTSAAASVAPMMQSFNTMKSGLTASGATIDTSGLIVTTASQSGDTAQVKVSGKLKVTVSGNSTDAPFTDVTIPMKNESGWKVCA